MAIYLIQRKGGDFDENHAHVIEARDEIRVRRMAAEIAADEPQLEWIDEQRSTVTLVGASVGDAPERIILTDFAAG